MQRRAGGHPGSLARTGRDPGKHGDGCRQRHDEAFLRCSSDVLGLHISQEDQQVQDQKHVDDKMKSLFNCSLTHSLIHSLTHLHTHSLIHSLTHLHTPSLSRITR